MNYADPAIALPIIRKLLQRSGLPVDCDYESLNGDGSDRIFFRLVFPDHASILAVFPSPTLPQAMAEARAVRYIGGHLYGHGVPVPEIIDFDEETGCCLCEDFGSNLLHDVIRQSGQDWPTKKKHYSQSIAGLVRLQLAAPSEFDTGYCWDTLSYDKELMLTRESGYFHKALWQDYLGMEPLADETCREFEKLAARAAQEPAHFIMHRDFQCRNIMVKEKGIGIIDFQGARLGPLGYDLASLLLDPYAGLAEEEQNELFGVYLAELAQYIDVDPEGFGQGYYYLALQRNLQILGAFAFLTQVRGKSFFRQFLIPAARSLVRLLRKEQGGDFPSLLTVACRVEELLTANKEK